MQEEKLMEDNDKLRQEVRVMLSKAKASFLFVYISICFKIITQICFSLSPITHFLYKKGGLALLNVVQVFRDVLSTCYTLKMIRRSAKITQKWAAIEKHCLFCLTIYV